MKKILIVPFIFGIILIAIFALLSFEIYFKSSAEIELVYLNQQNVLIEQVSQNIQNYFENLELELSLIATTFSYSPINEHNFMIHVKPFYLLEDKKVKNVFYEDTKGIVQFIYPFNSLPGVIGKDFSFREYFHSCKNGISYITNYIISGGRIAQIKEKFPAVIIALPIKKSTGEFKGVLGSDIDLEILYHQFIKPNFKEQNTSFFLLDANNTILLAQDMKLAGTKFDLSKIKYKKFSKKEKGYYYFIENHKKNLITHKKFLIGKNQWSLLILTPAKNLTSIIYPVFLKIGGIALVFLIIFFGIAYFIFNLIIKVQTLTLDAMNKELEISQKIQQDFLPKIFPETPDYQFYAYSMPAKKVGGDFYDFVKVRDMFGVVIGDVCGKGMPAALFMMMSKTLLWLSAHKKILPEKTVQEFNNILNKFNLTNKESNLMYLTAIYGVLDPNNHNFTYVRAGHEPPLMYHHEKDQLAFLPSNDQSTILGVFDKINLEERQVKLEPGDFVLLYTDGLFDIFTKKGKGQKIDEQEILDLLAKDKDLSAQTFVNTLIEQVKAFGQQNLIDDITLVMIKRIS